MSRLLLMMTVVLGASLWQTAHAHACFVKDENISGEYVGPCVNGKAHGFGTAKGRDIYTGNFREGMKHGKGKYISGPRSANVGQIYEGEFREDMQNGFGKDTFPPSFVQKCVAKYGANRCVKSRVGTWEGVILVRGTRTLANDVVQLVGGGMPGDAERLANAQRRQNQNGDEGGIKGKHVVGLFHLLTGNIYKGALKNGLAPSGSSGPKTGRDQPGYYCHASSSDYVIAQKNPWGESWGKNTYDEARSVALANCRSAGGKNCQLDLGLCGKR